MTYGMHFLSCCKHIPRCRLAVPAIENECHQVEKTRELTTIATGKASSVSSQARAVTGVANSAAKASERQQAAFSQAKVVSQDAASAAEKAAEAFRCGTFLLLCQDMATLSDQTWRAVVIS